MLEAICQIKQFKFSGALPTSRIESLVRFDRHWEHAGRRARSELGARVAVSGEVKREIQYSR